MGITTYLFGAGASAGALPIVQDISPSLEKFKDVFRGENATGHLCLGLNDFFSTRQRLFEDIDWLITTVRNFASVDTLAKTLAMTGNHDDLRRLKVVISLFFNHLQRDGAIDSRYNTFFASILQEQWDALPNTVRILSWNYDFQFESAYRVFSGQKSIEDNMMRLNVRDRFWNEALAPDGFCIYKINGTASFRSSNTRYVFSGDKALYDRADCDTLHQYNILQNSKSTKCNLCFAWEKEGSAIPQIKEAIRDTRILVVIGYSFPFFNRKVDKDILGGISFEKIYVQDLYPSEVKERIMTLLPAIDERKIIPLSNVKQFHLPSELDL